jgi:hypothetical protein
MTSDLEGVIARAEGVANRAAEHRFMSDLARRFPSLRNAGGVEPWDPEAFIAWLNANHRENKAFYAGRFLLALWIPGADWSELGLFLPVGFDLVAAAQSWDQDHFDVVREWTKNPYTPFAGDWDHLIARRTSRQP